MQSLAGKMSLPGLEEALAKLGGGPPPEST